MASYYDTEGRLVSTTMVTDGQLVNETDYDPGNLSDWAVVSSDYDSNGIIFRKVVTYDDHHIVETDSNDDGTKPWSTLTTAYDANHQLDYTITIGLNGSRIFHDYDQQHSQSWSDIIDDYSTTNQLADEYISYFDGTSSRQHYVLDGSEPYISYLQVFNAQGRQTSITYSNSDGSSDAYTYDVDNTQTYASLVKHYDASGQFRYELLNNHDGTTEEILRNSLTSNNVYYTITKSDVHNNVTSVEVLDGLGNTSTAIFDVDGLQPWTSYYQSATAGRALESDAIYYRDGTVTSHTYPLNYGGSPGNTYDAQGNLVETAILTKSYYEVTTYDPENLHSWSTIQQYFLGPTTAPYSTVTTFDNGTIYTVAAGDPADQYSSGFYYQTSTGAVISGGAGNSDGSSRYYTYDLTGNLPYSLTQDYYNPEGALYREDFTFRDGTYRSFLTDLSVNGNDPLHSWTSIENFYSNTQDFTYDTPDAYIAQFFDHTWGYVQFDLHDKYNWNSDTQIHNALGSLVSDAVVYDNGTSTKTVYDTENTSTLAYEVFSYDASHNLTQTHSVYDDGHTADVMFTT